MDLKADTTVTIQVDLNTGWYAHDFLCAYPRGDGLGRRGVRGNVRQVKTPISGEASILRQLLVFISRENASLALLARLISNVSHD